MTAFGAEPAVDEFAPRVVDEGGTRSGHRGAITGLAFSTVTQHVASSSVDGTAYVWPMGAKHTSRPNKFAAHKGTVHALEYAPPAGVGSVPLLATASADRTVRLWTPTGRDTPALGAQGAANGSGTVLKGHTGGVRAVHFFPEGKQILTCGDDKTVKIWALPAARFVATLSGHTNWVRCAAVNPTSRAAASGSDDRTVRLWDLSSGKSVHTYYDPTDLLTSTLYSPDGVLVAATGHDSTVRIWDTRTHALLQHYEAAHQGPVHSMAWHPAGHWLLTAGEDASVKVWDLREGVLYFTLYAHTGPATAVCFSQQESGHLFATGGADRLVRIYHTNFDRALPGQYSAPATPSTVSPERRSRTSGGNRSPPRVLEEAPHENGVYSEPATPERFSLPQTAEVPNYPLIPAPSVPQTDYATTQAQSHTSPASIFLTPVPTATTVAPVDAASEQEESPTPHYLSRQIDILTETLQHLTVMWERSNAEWQGRNAALEAQLRQQQQVHTEEVRMLSSTVRALEAQLGSLVAAHQEDRASIAYLHQALASASSSAR